MKPREGECQSSLSQNELNKMRIMSQSPQNQKPDSTASKGMPIYFDDGRQLTDIAEEDDKRHDWHPANPAATKLFRCVECLRDIEAMLKGAGRSKNKVKQRRKMKIMLTSLHSLATGIRDLLNDLENNPDTIQKLPKGAREIVPKLRTRFLANVAIGNGDLLSQARNKISAHVDKDLQPREARTLLGNAKPAQVGWWLHSCVTVLADVIKLPVYFWSVESEHKDWIRIMFNEPLLSTITISNGRIEKLIALHFIRKPPRRHILELLMRVVKDSAWLFGPNDPRIRKFVEDEPGATWAKSLIALPDQKPPTGSKQSEGS